MAKPEVAVVSAKLFELHTKLQEGEKELEQLYENWEALSAQLS